MNNLVTLLRSNQYNVVFAGNDVIVAFSWTNKTTNLEALQAAERVAFGSIKTYKA